MSEEHIPNPAKQSQLDEMREWFYSNYERPEENTPYDGGFVYIWGGPYEPGEVLHSAFCGEIPADVIDELVEELEGESYQWAGIPGPEDFDDYTYDAISSNTEFHTTFTDNMNVINQLLSNTVSSEIENNYFMMLFVNVITGLETYLSDAFINTVMNNKSSFRKFVETNPKLANEKISRSEIFDEMDKINNKVKKDLLDLMWHNLAKIKPMYKKTLGIEFPKDTQDIFRAIVNRHDIVHRSGKTKSGEDITVTKNNVIELIGNVSSLIAHIDNQLIT